MRKQYLKLKELLTDSSFEYFKEVLILVDLGLNLLK